MSDVQAIADRFEIEALRGEFTDAGMMRDYDRFASLFIQDGVWRIPDVNVEFVSREEIRAGIEWLQGLWDYFVQTVHPGTIRLEGDTAVGRAIRLRVRALSRRQLAAELLRLPRPLPAHPRRLEVHGARLRGQIPRHHSAGGCRRPTQRGRPLTRNRGQVFYALSSIRTHQPPDTHPNGGRT